MIRAALWKRTAISSSEPTRSTGVLCLIFLICVFASWTALADVTPTADYEEVIHSIYEYSPPYPERAQAIVSEIMKQWGEDAYLRWRPVRIEPRELLNGDISSAHAVPTALQFSVFPDTIIQAQESRYTYFEETRGAIWRGTIPGIEFSYVEINIVVDTTKKLKGEEESIGFSIRIWDQSRHFYIFPTEDLDVYVAIEGRKINDRHMKWHPNN